MVRTTCFKLGRRGISLEVTPLKSESERIRLVRLIILFVQRDLKVRYRGSVLGYCWSMMNPLLYMVILSFVFKHVVRFQMENYAMYILSGILGWNLFQQTLAQAVHSLVSSGPLLKKIKVPALLFPAANVCSVLVNFLLALIPFVVIALFVHLKLSWAFFLIPAVIFPYLVFIFGAALTLACLNVFFRDIGHMIESVLMIVFYCTPIIYPKSVLPENYLKLLNFNPLYHYTEAIREVMFYGQSPSLGHQLYNFGFAIMSLAIGLLVYGKSRDKIVFKI